MVISVHHETRPVPSVEFDHGMQLEMSFRIVLGIKTKDATKDRPMSGKRIEMAELRLGGVDHLADYWRLTGVVARRPCA